MAGRDELTDPWRMQERNPAAFAAGEIRTVAGNDSVIQVFMQNSEKWTIERGVVWGYSMPFAQNPAYSPPWPDGDEPARRPVVGALARPARARAVRRWDWRVREYCGSVN